MNENVKRECLTRAARVYISSSWKNRERVRTVAGELRQCGHEVYDFTDPASRKTPEIPPERFPEAFDPERGSYPQYITSVPGWRQAVDCNREALNWCDVVVLLLPCGADAHADWAYGVGRGKRSCVVGAPKAGERTPTHMWADALLATDGEIGAWLKSVDFRAALAAPCPCAGMRQERDAARLLKLACDTSLDNAAQYKAERDQIRAERQRLWDLVRYQRFELHAAGLISNAEYADLAKDHAAVARLESYDELRAQLTASQERERVYREALTKIRGGVPCCGKGAKGAK